MREEFFSSLLDRFGDRPLLIDGTDEFKRQLVEVATVEGMNVIFADSVMEAERQHRVAVARPRQAGPPNRPTHTNGQAMQAPEVEAFIAQRNAARGKAQDIQPYRAWISTDAGDATYAGRRHFIGGTEAVLLNREGTTLVKVVSPAQAAKASTWRIGDIVRVDDRGRFHDHRQPAENVKDEHRR